MEKQNKKNKERVVVELDQIIHDAKGERQHFVVWVWKKTENKRSQLLGSQHLWINEDRTLEAFKFDRQKKERVEFEVKVRRK